MPDEFPRRRAAILLAAAAVAGLAAGAVAVYFMRSGDGNGVNVANADCSGALETAERVDPFAGGQVAAFRVTREPDYLGGLAFRDGDGQEMTLADLGGKTLLVNLWATWCVPCRTEMPALDRLQADLGGEDFSVVAINIDLDAEARARAFYEEISIESLDFYSDPTTGVFNDLKKRGLAIGLPTTLLVDGEGCEVGSLQGPAEWDSEDAKKLIGAAIGS